MSQIHRLGLGTAQFGEKYGVTNRGSRPARKECEQIVWLAYEAGIRNFDTAAYYGTADAILALSLPGPAKVTSKVKDHADLVRTQRLFGKNLHGIYGTPGCVSMYWDAPDLDGLRLVQLPLNMADRRNLPLIDRLHLQGTEVHARSIFLQGLLLERGATIRQCLKFVLDTPVDVALVGVNSVAELQEIIEAVETLDQEHEMPIPLVELHELDPRAWR